MLLIHRLAVSHVRPLPSPPEGKDTHTSSLNMAPRALQEPKGAFFCRKVRQDTRDTLEFQRGIYSWGKVGE